ncbi:MAG: AIR synthase-related protein, partial [Verrucomicrobiota bacterium]
GGGEPVSVPVGAPVFISVAGMGRVECERCVTRGGGRAGQLLWVTGELGGSYGSGKHLDFRPRVREGQWLALHVGPGAMMDLSDGLGRDLPRLAEASGCDFELSVASVPCYEECSIEQALGDGEDMELLFTTDDEEWVIEFELEFPQTAVSRIGRLVARGEGESQLGSGWEHFRK